MILIRNAKIHVIVYSKLCDYTPGCIYGTPKTHENVQNPS